MKHGNKIFCSPRRLFFLMALVLVGSAFNSCKSSRNMVEETRTGFHYNGQDSTRVDSVLMGGNERSSESDTTSVSTGASGAVEIKRDSVGRPIKIIWTHSAIVSTLSKRNTEAQNWFYGLNATRHSESSGAVDSVATKKEKVTQTVDTRISLVNIIGPVLLVLVIYIFWQWIKQKRSR